ncbi:ATP-dependent exonuclease SbcCD, C subunit-like protein [Candidatus Binatia bacterium]|nr:ATP-dependent exonuclease SbcCD, C subunit-like protein [Candidatus Binatia bacterium]
MTGERGSSAVELAPRPSRPGFRLARLEVFNWGTFDGRVWTLDTRGENTLLTGDIGSGKSTLVDAITTLLVPPARLAYNKAAGAEARERTLRSYVLGHYKSERADSVSSARAVALRGRDSFSVVLGRFESAGETVTLAQVFWTKDVEGQPARMLVVAARPLSIVEHFSNFGREIGDLRKRLRRDGCEVHDTFPPYAAAFRRLLGIENEQALELFHQTVSMKSVGNLTDFVREHMLQPAATEGRVQALIAHFDDLNRAHESVLKARAQIERLEPLVADCERHAAIAREVDELRAAREALRPWFARTKGALVETRLAKLGGEIARLEERVRRLAGERTEHGVARDGVLRAIAENGGDRIEQLKLEAERQRVLMEGRRARSGRYEDLVRAVGLEPLSDGEAFRRNRESLDEMLRTVDEQLAEQQNTRTEGEVELHGLRRQHDEVARELASLRKRRSNIPASMLELRSELCDALGVSEGTLPFAGELIQVHEKERDWEGAIERVLHNFGLSLLVPDPQYLAVAEWVDRTHLRARLVYYRVRSVRTSQREPVSSDSLVRKLTLLPESSFYDWLDAEVARRFDLTCCDSLDAFRRATRAITRAGQVKGSGERHEKDDRHRLDDRSRYVLGWTNEAKIAAYEKDQRALELRIQRAAQKVAASAAAVSALTERRGKLQQVGVFEVFDDLDWQPLVSKIEALELERERLESGSDALRALQARLRELDTALAELEKAADAARSQLAATQERHAASERVRSECASVVAQATAAALELLPRVDALVVEALGEPPSTVESCDARERDVRDWLQARIDAEDAKLRRLVEKITQAMEAYRNAYPVDAREADASVASADEYRTMLDRLRGDDLPRFERRFKELLNENTIREVAGFQSHLMMERATIRERIETINRSLRDIDYNPGRYMVLEPAPTPDAEIRDFQQDLRACTEGALTGSDDDTYSEAKFLQVKRIIERFRGRDGTSEIDRRWTEKVTDVRNWFAFSASERWREDDREHEHYTDAGGKSGGQKEKLAYTVLAASLAYQFGLDSGGSRARSFRFVVIDEAFGRGSDESTRYGLELFDRLALQLLVVTPLQKIHVIEPHVASVGFVHNDGGRRSMIRNLTIEEYRAEQAARTA